MDSVLLRGYQCPPDVFADLCASLLQAGTSIRFIAQGDSMLPSLRSGDRLICEPAAARQLKVGDVVFFLTADGQAIFHRIIRARKQDGTRSFLVQADNSLRPDGWKSAGEILGRVSRIIRVNGAVAVMDSMKMSLINKWAAFRSRSKLNRFHRLRALEQGFIQVI